MEGDGRPQPPSTRELPIAVALVVLSCALMAASMLIAKTLGPAAAGSEALHPMQVSAGRYGFALLLLLPVVAWLRIDFRDAEWTNHVLRALFGWAGVTCLFAASSLMLLADATAISFLNPIVAMILSIPLLGEKVGPWRWVGAALAFAGAVVVAQPGTAAFQPVALIALLSAVFIGIEVVLVKRLADREPGLRILFLSNAFGAAIAICAAVFVWKWPSAWQWSLLVATGAIMATAQALFIGALRRADASFVTPFLYSVLIFAALFDFVVFGVLPQLAGWLGAGLIVCGALLVAWRERVRHVRQRKLPTSAGT